MKIQKMRLAPRCSECNRPDWYKPLETRYSIEVDEDECDYLRWIVRDFHYEAVRCEAQVNLPNMTHYRGVDVEKLRKMELLFNTTV